MAGHAFNYSEIYTPLSIAKKELKKRWKDESLRKRIDNFWAGNLPEIFQKKPRAVLFRFIATPNLEFKRFFDLSKMSKLGPVYVEFLDDKFCTRNQDKMCLVRIMVSDGKNKRKKKIIAVPENDNKKFSNIKTLWGEKLIDFHHRVFSLYHNNEKIDTYDLSTLKKKGESAKDVYVKLLSLFLRNGILFENYIAKDNTYEKEFTNTVVLPAIREVTERFQCKPLIVPLLPINEEEQTDWMWYNKFIEKYIPEIV